VSRQWKFVIDRVTLMRTHLGSLFVVGPYVLENYALSNSRAFQNGKALRLLATQCLNVDNTSGGNHNSLVIERSLYARLSDWSSHLSLNQYHASVIVFDHLCYYYFLSLTTVDALGAYAAHSDQKKKEAIVCRSLETDELIWKVDLLTGYYSHDGLDALHDDTVCSSAKGKGKLSSNKKKNKTKKKKDQDQFLSLSPINQTNVNRGSFSGEKFVKRMVQDIDVLCAFGVIEPCVLHVIFKGHCTIANNKPGVVKGYRATSDILSVVLTPNYIVLGTENGVEIVSKGLEEDKMGELIAQGGSTLKLHGKVDLSSNHYSHSIHLSSVYFDYVTRNERDVFYVDKRMSTLGTIVLECYSCESAKLIYRYDMYASGLTGFIDSTQSSSDLWCVTGGTFDKCRQSHLIDLKTGLAVVLNDQAFKSCHIAVEVVSSFSSFNAPETCIGICSMDRRLGKCSYYRRCEGNRQPELLWTMDIPELPNLKYYPNVQVMVIRDVMFILLFEGSICFLYCIVVETGKIVWHHRILDELLEENRCSSFDINIRMCALNVEEQQVCISGTIKPYGFFCCLATRQTGLGLVHVSSWAQHSERLKTFTVVDDETNKHCVHSSREHCIIA